MPSPADDITHRSRAPTPREARPCSACVVPPRGVDLLGQLPHLLDRGDPRAGAQREPDFLEHVHTRLHRVLPQHAAVLVRLIARAQDSMQHDPRVGRYGELLDRDDTAIVVIFRSSPRCADPTRTSRARTTPPIERAKSLPTLVGGRPAQPDGARWGG